MEGEKQYHADTFMERRKHPRLPVKIDVHFHALGSLEEFAVQKSESLNIGAGGVALRSAIKVEAGKKMMLTLFIPPEHKRAQLGHMARCPEEECMEINIQAKVVWVSPFLGDKYLLGVQFLQISQDDQAYLKTFLEDYKLPEPNPLIAES